MQDIADVKALCIDHGHIPEIGGCPSQLVIIPPRHDQRLRLIDNAERIAPRTFFLGMV